MDSKQTPSLAGALSDTLGLTLEAIPHLETLEQEYGLRGDGVDVLEYVQQLGDCASVLAYGDPSRGGCRWPVEIDPDALDALLAEPLYDRVTRALGLLALGLTLMQEHP